MIRLGENPKQYPGLALEQCGLLFLSTPHSGTDEANWSDFLAELAKIGGVGRGRDFTQLLGAFNRESASAKERFGLLQPVPPFTCIYETQKTSIKGIQRTIVSPDSAGLNGERAQPMSYADHRTVCRFRDKNDQRYLQVLDCLDGIRQRLVDERRQEQPHQENQQEQPADGRTSTKAAPRIARGGDAHGGDAVSHATEGKAEGGKATGGSATAARGSAIGGAAVGGSASLL
ncbi:hypothetical protein SPI_05918 [Niveomyces insectorum RCEF 264]|uniref:Uncharacterized protein n=1 Tax=Niveomyces insectorum RCEF 264 TaxID=1081102 RepID=A0A167SL27_9HYPO|nr:hypothetical protein SPI_05918 [Niveomyces insectorum RCEF 264]